MAVAVSGFGEHNGQRVDQFRLTSDTGVSVDIIGYGVVVRDWRVPVAGGERSVVLGFDQFDAYPAHSPHFGSLAEVIAAPAGRLGEVKGLGPTAAADIKLIHAAALSLTGSEMRRKTVLGSWSQVLDYCRAAMAFEEKEQFRLLFLDKKNQLIRDEVQQVGTVDHTPVYPREVVKRALELSSTAIILVHNHPSGDPTPSRADIDMTKTIIDIATPLGIQVHDHIIIARDGHASLKGLQLI